MILNSVLGNLTEVQPDGGIIETIFLTWDEAQKRRLRKTTDMGTEVGIERTGHHPFRNGDVLYHRADRMIIVRLVEEEVIVIRPRNWPEMGEVCYHLGNRHVGVAITGGEVLTPYDPVTYAMLSRLGVDLGVRQSRLEGVIQAPGGHVHG